MKIKKTIIIRNVRRRHVYRGDTEFIPILDSPKLIMIMNELAEYIKPACYIPILTLEFSVK